MLRELNVLEKANSLEKYCSMPVVAADVTIPVMDPKDAILPDDMNVILDDTKVPDKSGYCMLENGGSYATVKSELPGVTKKMLQWMVAWQGLEPINYMALNPETHHSAAVSDIDREKIMREFLSVEEKCQGIYVYSIDKINGELVGTITSYLSPAEQGLCLDKYTKSGVLTIGGSVLIQKHEEADPQEKSLEIMVSVVKDKDNGVEVQTHVWGGYKILRCEAKRFDVNGIQPTKEYTEMMANHIANKWAQIGNVLPQLYKEING